MRGSLLLFIFTLGIGTLTAQTVDTIWYEDFDGGLNKFTANPGLSDAEATWYWSPNGEGDSVYLADETLVAAFWGDNLPGIVSPTFFNGAALFNSDAFDSNGGDPGTGPYLTPHTGELVSETIDCSGRETVMLSFYQFARVLFDNYTTVEVSNDGGVSWTNFPINERVFSNEINAIISPDTWTYIDISEVAANESNVQIRFTWLDADYYFWLIDDVVLTEAPEYNVKVDTIFYPVSSFGTPVSQIASDTFGFSAHISNHGTLDMPEVVVRASVYNTFYDPNGDIQLGDEIFADSTILDVLPAGYRDSIVSIEDTFAPEVDTGRYIIFYEVFSDDEDIQDYYPFDNVRSSSFQVTPGLFSKDNGFLFEDAETPVGFIFEDDYYMGNVYTMSNLAGTGFAATTADFAAGRSTADGSIAGNETTLTVYRVKDRVGPGFAGFNVNSTGDPLDDEDDLIQVGYGQYIFQEGHDPFTTVQVELADLDGNAVPLDPGARYIIVCQYLDDNSNVSHLFADDYDYPNINQGFISSLIFTQDEWTGIDSRNTISPILRMSIEMVDAIDETPLPETAMSLFPNPTSDILKMQLDLEAPTEAVVIITDITGKILRWQEYDSLQSEVLEFNVSSYASGQYFIRLGTELGTKTKKFVVAR